MKCLICEKEFENKRKLATHLQTKHKITSKDYTITYLFNGEKPKCPICEKTPRYVSFSFKTFCKEHSRLAESEAGKIGGKKKKTWNKGQTKETNKTLNKISKQFSGEGNPFFGKTHLNLSKEQMIKSSRLEQNEFQERIKKRENEFEVLTSYKDYKKRQGFYLQTKCKNCGTIEDKTLMAFERGSLCKTCFPSFFTSQQENKIADFISSLGFLPQRNVRNIILPKELDIFISEKNFAIEFNGLYFHTTQFVDKKHHLQKTQKCNEKNIELFHIFSDEWENKQDIIKSMLAYRLGVVKERIYARECVIKQVSKKEAEPFFKNNHIDGNTNASVYFLLYDKNNRIVAGLSLKKPIQKKYGNVCEIARFATLQNIAVVGGLSKLLKIAEKYAKENGFIGVLTYANKRFAERGCYDKMGFIHIKNTSPGYFYTNGVKRWFRFKFRAQNNPKKTEKQVAKENGVYPVYDCGHSVYLKLFEK